MPHQINILSCFLFHLSLVYFSVSFRSLSCMYNEQTKGTPQSLNWGCSGQIMIVNGKKPNHLSQSLISTALPDFLLLLYLQWMIKAVATASSQENKSQLKSESKYLRLWISWDQTAIFPALVAPQVDWNELHQFWMKVNTLICKTMFSLKWVSIWGHSWENMEAPEPFSHYTTSELTGLPQVSETAVHRLGTTCVLRRRLTGHTLKIGKPSPRGQENRFFS